MLRFRQVASRTLAHIAGVVPRQHRVDVVEVKALIDDPGEGRRAGESHWEKRQNLGFPVKKNQRNDWV